jgi:hypothetical protein
MEKMMPMMMKDIDMDQMDSMMDTMIPTMMNMMREKGIDIFQMMEKMCPKCVSVATSRTTTEDKENLKKQMAEVFEKL